ncbi:hypothetical protein [Ralstonia insidiosa]|uniref:hypothetical protein n=1 Tax=Ralstonia insidiosa TaxID=190721 RepID=UPI001FC91CA0|nr:hypothetical protein [Ralstonia insidiosa]
MMIALPNLLKTSVPRAAWRSFPFGCWMPLWMQRRIRQASRYLALAGIILILVACSGPPPNERETGSGGTLVRYSSRQVSVDLTDAEQQSLRAMRDRTYANIAPDRALSAVAKALTELGYAPVSVDNETGLVEAGLSDTLVPKWRQLLRGALKNYTGMFPAKPDHERVSAVIAVKAGTGSQSTLVRARFDSTVWDSNGDARTKTVLKREVYDGFFAGVDKVLCSAACKGQP